MTNYDELTGLRGRMTFDDDLRQAIADSDGVGLALIDVDHFKELNDTFGHARGDELLKEIAGLLREAAPERIYRLGGDEFAVIMGDMSLEQAFLRMEALRSRFMAQAPALASGRQVTVTIGVAQHPRDAKDARDLTAAAGAALAAAKEAGRNQVCLPPTAESMVMKTCYYPASSIAKLKTLAERARRKESQLLREALDDLLRKYDAPGATR